MIISPAYPTAAGVVYACSEQISDSPSAGLRRKQEAGRHLGTQTAGTGPLIHGHFCDKRTITSSSVFARTAIGRLVPGTWAASRGCMPMAASCVTWAAAMPVPPKAPNCIVVAGSPEARAPAAHPPAAALAAA